jgi:hypothetical protein
LNTFVSCVIRPPGAAGRGWGWLRVCGVKTSQAARPRAGFGERAGGMRRKPPPAARRAGGFAGVRGVRALGFKNGFVIYFSESGFINGSRGSRRAAPFWL